MESNEPLIWTCRGLMPADQLDYKVRWTVSDDEICFEEIYFAKDDGTEVKHAAHKYLPKASLPVGVEQGAF